MHIYGKQVFDTSAVDGVGFPAASLRRATEDYLKEYQRNSQFSEWLKKILTEHGPLGESPRVVHVASDSAPFFPDAWGAHDCQGLDDSRTAMLGQVLDRVNQQLQSWGMGQMRFSLEPPAAGAEPDVRVSDCALDWAAGFNDRAGIPNRFVVDFGRFNWAGYRLFALEEFRQSRPGKAVAHELAHVFGDHPQDVAGFHKAPPDLLGAMCEAGAHSSSQSVLIYQEVCLRKGYLGYENFGQGEFGTLELGLIKSAWVGNDTEQQLLALQETSTRMMEAIRRNYGAKVAGHFAATFCREMVNSVISHAIYQNVKNPGHQRILLDVTRMLAFILQAVLLSQRGLTTVCGVALSVFSSIGCVSQTLKALANLLGSLGLLNVMLALIRGNSYALFSLLSGFGGALAGKVAAEMFNTLCSCSLSRDEKYLERKLDASIHDSRNILTRVNEPGSMLTKLAALDNMLGKTIDRYASLNFLYEKIFPKRQTRQTDPASTPAPQQQAVELAGPLPPVPPGMTDPVDVDRLSETAGAAPTIDPVERDRALREMEEGVNQIAEGLSATLPANQENDIRNPAQA